MKRKQLFVEKGNESMHVSDAKKAKKARVDREKVKKLVSRALPRIFAAIELGVGDQQMVAWVRETRDFSELLKKLAESLGDTYEVENQWLHGLCCLITDLSEQFSRDCNAPMEAPRDVILWLRLFVQELFSKAELSWEGKIFTVVNIEEAWRFLEILQQKKEANTVL